MNDDIDAMTVGVRADTAGFARDVAQLRDTLQTSLGQGATQAGQAIETSLARAVASGRSGFDALKASGLAALDGIAASALKLGFNSLVGGSGSSAGQTLGTLLGGLAGGSPGRATGGPVSPGRAYTVGERGPELFVPTTSGRIDNAAGSSSSGRDVRVAITINAGSGQAPGALQQSSRQVARAVKAALAD